MRFHEVARSFTVLIVLIMCQTRGPQSEGADIAFPKVRPAGGSFSRPRQLEASTVNPPGFCWWRAGPEDEVAYRLLVRDATGQVVYESRSLSDPVDVPDRTFAAGDYRWTVQALDTKGKIRDTFGPRSFSIAPNAYQQPWVAPAELLARVPRVHPRLLFPKGELDTIRASLKTTRAEAFSGLQGSADRVLKLKVPPEPDYDKIKDPSQRRLAYGATFGKYRGYHQNGMQPAALMYLMSGEEKYGQAAKRILLGATQWDPEGISSVMAPYGDEVGLSLAKSSALTYDWIYDLLSEEERVDVETMLVARADQMLRRLKRRDYLARPESSHDGRLPGYLLEHAIVLADHPRAEVWMDYALRTIMTVFPHWGGQDGGWAEGISYGMAYNGIFVTPLESMRIATGMDLWQRPFFGKVRYFFLYNVTPRGEIAGFGDSYNYGVPGRAGGLRGLLQFHAERFDDPTVRGWLELLRADGQQLPSLPSMPGLILPQTVHPKLPLDLPPDAVFHGVGWAALHSDLSDPENDLFVSFKSSPYGGVSHSYCDQNGFAILKGGRALARPGGERYPQHGTPFHTKYTQQTIAQNSILVDGHGQKRGDSRAVGQIADFQSTPEFGYVCGDATSAYAGRLTRFRRHVLLLRPSVVCLVDDLQAPQAAEFQWLMHSFDRLDLDESSQTFVSSRGDATMKVHLLTPNGFRFEQTNQWPIAPKEGYPTATKAEPQKLWHFTAATDQKAKTRRIAAIMVIGDKDEDPQCEIRRLDGDIVELRAPGVNGQATVRINLAISTTSPTSVLEVRSLGENGEETVFETE